MSDTLGKYIKVTANYAVHQTTVQAAASSLSASITHNASDTEPKQNLSASGTATWTFGPYDYDDADPHGGYQLGTISLSDRFYTRTANIQLVTTGYTNPAITSISSYRVEEFEEDGAITFEDSDDGTCLGLDLSWAVANTPSQTDPTSVMVVVRDMDAADALHEIVATRTYNPTGTGATFYIYPDSQQWPDDVVIGGELINTAHRYTVDAIVSDLYSDVVISGKAKRSDSVTVAYFTMDFLAGGHGVAFGKPSTQAELLDVGYGASFDGDVDASGDIKSDGEVTATDANDVLHNLTEKIDAVDVENGYLPLAGGTLTGALGGTTAAFSDKVEAGTYLQAKDNIVVGPSTTSASTAFDSTNPKIEFQNVDASQKGQLIFTDYDAVHTGATLAWITNQTQSWFHTQHIHTTGNVYSNSNHFIKDTTVDTSSATNGITSNTYKNYSVLDNTGANVNNGVSFSVANNGTLSVSVSTQPGWRNALGASSGTWPVSVGGTGRSIGANRTFWCGRIIYDNNSGSSGNITVTETFANFAFVLIGFKENDGYYDGMFVRSPNNKTVILHTTESTVNGANNSKWQTRTLSGTACNVSHYSDNNTSSNHIYITHIIGFA